MGDTEVQLSRKNLNNLVYDKQRDIEILLFYIQPNHDHKKYYYQGGACLEGTPGKFLSRKPSSPAIQASTSSTVLGTVLISTVQYSTVQYSRVQYSTVQYLGTVLIRSAPVSVTMMSSSILDCLFVVSCDCETSNFAKFRSQL